MPMLPNRVTVVTPILIGGLRPPALRLPTIVRHYDNADRETSIYFNDNDW